MGTSVAPAAPVSTPPASETPPVLTGAPAPPAAPAPAGSMEDALAALERQGEAGLLPGQEPPPPPEPDPETPLPPADPEAEPPAEPAPPKPEAAQTFTVEFPAPPGSRDTALLRVSYPTQEAADRAKFHVKQSARVPQLEQELESAQQDRAMLDFFEQRPVEGFTLLATKKPESASRWLRHRVMSDPADVISALEELGYAVQPQKDPETIQYRSELARRDLLDEARQSEAAHVETTTLRQFNATGGAVIREVAAATGMELGPPGQPTEDFLVFATAAHRLLAKSFAPGARRDDMLLALQPLAQKAAQYRTTPATATVVAAAAASPGAPAPVPPAASAAPRPDPATAFAQRDADQARFQRLTGGSSLITALGVEKAQAPNETYEQYLDRLGQSR